MWIESKISSIAANMPTHYNSSTTKLWQVSSAFSNDIILYEAQDRYRKFSRNISYFVFFAEPD